MLRSYSSSGSAAVKDAPGDELAVGGNARGRGDHRGEPVVGLRGAEADVDERDLAALERLDDHALVSPGSTAKKTNVISVSSATFSAVTSTG